MTVDHHRPPARWRQLGTLAVVVLATVVLATCGEGEVVEAGADDVIDHARDRELVLQVRRVGGFLPARVFADVPTATVLGDGTMIIEGAQIEIFPPPALPPLFQVRLSQEGLQEVLAHAKEAGLLSPPPDYGTPPVADATTTVITVHAEGEQVTHEIYALAEAASDTPGLSERQEQRREGVLRFVGALGAPDQGLVPPEEVSRATPFAAQRFAIRAQPAPPGDEEPVEGIEPQVLEWPVPEVDLGGAAECRIVHGEQAARLAEALTGATTLTRFRQEGVAYQLAVRPLVPPEETCEDVGAR